jgi:GINS complex subunit 3
LNALKADPRTVDLRALAPHFYNLGARILELFEEEEMIEVPHRHSRLGLLS